MIAIAVLTLAAAAAPAQTTTSAATPAKSEVTTTAAPVTTSTSATIAPVVVEGRSSEEVRGEFEQVLDQSPSEIGHILALDPTLLSDDAYLSRYPELARFVAAHPEVRHNPHYYLRRYDERLIPRRNPAEEILEPIMIFAVFTLIAFVLGWIIRTVIDQKRWNRLSRTQAEVHGKILDRFGSTAELLDYIRTPAGAKFLESAPIPLHTESKPQNLPAARVLWSVQIGVIVATAGLGIVMVSNRFEKEGAQALFALGAIALSVGIGFILAAVVSLLLSRRLGLWSQPEQDETPSNP